MAKKDLTLTLLAAHTAALEKTMQAVEVQVASTKTALKLLNEYIAETAVTPNEDDDNEVDAEEKPAKKKPAKPAKKKVEKDEDEETDEDESESEDEEESDSEDEDEESEDEEESELDREDVVAALQAYAAKHDKAKAIKIMKKITGVENTHKVAPKHYAALIKALK